MIRLRQIVFASAVALLLAGTAVPVRTQSVAAGPQQSAWPGLPPGAVEEAMILRDGTRLAANVFKPASEGSRPVVLLRRSQDFYDAFENDIEDGYDSVEWAAARPWTNGKVGMTGPSAQGTTANAAAMAAPPHLKAAYVIVAPADRLDYSYPGGVLKEEDTIGWLRAQGVSEEKLNEAYQRAQDDVSWNRSAMTTNRKYVRIPIYNVGGWYDIFNGGMVDNFTWLQNHGAAGAHGNQKLLMGPFGHGKLSGDLAYPGSDQLSLSQDICWFDYWLKSEENGIMGEPPVLL